MQSSRFLIPRGTPRFFSASSLGLSAVPPIEGPSDLKAKIPGILKNEKIPFSRVHLVGQDGNMRLVSLKETLRSMDSKAFDLVIVSNNSPSGDKFPICKIVSKKAAFEKLKASNKKIKNPAAVLKEIEITTVITDHDLSIKLNKASGFLEKGHKVQFSLLHRKRETASPDFSRILKAIQESLDGLGKEQTRSQTVRHKMILIYATVNSPVSSKPVQG